MIKVGFVGCGRIAQVRHIPECNEHPDVEIVGYYNRTREKAIQMADMYGGKVFERAEDCILNPEVEVVIISTPNATHAPYSILALCAGKHVICEKPMAITKKECEQMVDVAQKSDRILLIAYHERYTQTHKLAKRLIEEGTIGKVLAFQTILAHGGPDKKRVADNLWFFDKKMAGFGVSADLGVHKIDTIRYLLGDEIEEVTARIDSLDGCEIDDNAIYLVKMKNGALGTITVSWTCYGDEINSTIILGTNGNIKIKHPYCGEVEVAMKDGTTKCYHEEEIYRVNGWTDSGIIREIVRLINEKAENKGSVYGEDSIRTMDVLFDGLKSRSND
ncbi:MAG: Gfo/Idh/MocA family protein [Lachnospiraceae bacterium]